VDGFPGLRIPPRGSVTVDGVAVGRGSRVVLRPRAGGDILDQALAGRSAVVEAIHEDLDGKVLLAVTVEDDPGRHLGEARRPGHRFFYGPEEVEPLAPTAATALPRTRVLVAGIGNTFMADDGFGVAVAHALRGRGLPDGVDVTDFGIRGMDLVFALGEGYDAAVFVDAVPRDAEPGTLLVIEHGPGDDDGIVSLDTHGMDPVKVLALARQLGPVPDRILVVGCVPLVTMTGDEEDLVGELSPPVAAAVGPAAALVERLVADLLEADRTPEEEAP